MPSAMSLSDRPVRVPAWKRLGLKLKSGNEQQQTQTQPLPAPPASETKRKRTVDNLEETNSKKIKISKPKQKLKSITPNQSPLASETIGRKSVTFAADAKATDGESTKQLFNAWVAEQKKQNPSFNPRVLGPAFSTPQPPRVVEDVDITLDESERRVKRVKAPKKERKEKPARISKSTKVVNSKGKSKKSSLESALAYLTTFHNSKSTWKFNKVHQTNVLKNAFNLELIPASYSELLYFYIAGLKGGARTQLRDAALAIKVKDQEEGESGLPEDMANPSKAQQEYEAALAEYVAFTLAHEAPPETGYEEGVLMGLSDFAMKPRMEKRMRAERILIELGRQAAEETSGNGTVSADVPKMDGSNDQNQLRNTSGLLQKSRRKRKQRTAVVDLTSSSEDSSDSDDDKSDERSPTKAVAVGHDGSSSSTSSSGSDHEEE